MPAARPETLIMRQASLVIKAKHARTLDELAAQGFRVTVEGNNVRRVFEPMDADRPVSDDPFAAVTYGKP